MSRTVSFRCSEDLDEFLEREAERRMTTKSTVAQMLVAQKAQEIQGGDASKGDEDPVNTVDGDALDRHPDAWYRPDGESKFAVRDPEGSNIKYYKTREGADARIRRWYEGEEGLDGRQV